MKRPLYLLPLLLTACFSPKTNGGNNDDSTSSGSTSSPTSAGQEASTSSPTSPGETGDMTGSTGNNETCEEQQVCVEAAPEGWSNPGLRLFGERGQLPSCTEEGFPIEGTSGYEEAVGAPAECGCSCDYPTELMCPSAHATYYGGETCASKQQHTDQGPINCSAFHVGINGQNSATVVADPPEDVSCTPNASTTLAPLDFLAPTTLCLPESLGLACGEDSTCFPTAESNTYCIAQAGNIPCPANSRYNDRTVLFEEFQDARECTECECGSATTECHGSLILFDESDCSGNEIEIPIDDSCVESIPDSFNRSSYVPEEATGSCPPSGGEPTGDIEGRTPVTVCCATF